MTERKRSDINEKLRERKKKKRDSDEKMRERKKNKRDLTFIKNKWVEEEEKKTLMRKLKKWRRVNV